MKTLRIDFVDFWKGFNKYDNYFTNFLRKYFNLVFVSKPDYLVYSDYGSKHLMHDCIRIYYTGENLVPNFNVCDYAIGFHFIKFGDRYARFPNYKRYESYKIAKKKHINASFKKKSKICNFVYSNAKANPFRDNFFFEISKRFKVESGGKHLNNIGKSVNDKISFQKNFIFSLALENDSASGYTTEKIIDAFAAGTIPIYWGNPEINIEFNEAAFINLHAFDSTQEAIKYVYEVLQDVDMQESYLKSPIYNDLQIDRSKKEDKEFYDFFMNIFSQNMDSAKRRSTYAVSKNYQEALLRASLIQNNLIFRIFNMIYRIFNKIRKHYD